MISVPSARRGAFGLLLAALVPSVATVLLLPVRDSLNLVTHSLVLLMSVLAAALVGGLLPGIVAAVWATVLLNFFFIPPFHTFRVTDPNNVVALFVFALVAGIVSWAVDQAARRQNESLRAASLEATDRLRAALLAAVGHDLRTPIAAAKASVSGLLSDDVELSIDDRQELLEGADASLDRLSALVGNLLDLSRVQAGAMPVVMRPTAVDEALARALDDIGLHGQDVRIDIPDELPEVDADAGLLERVLANLLTNAVRFSPSGTPPTVTARAVDQLVEVAVVDRGPGIPASQHADVFRPFQRLGDNTNTEGLGLGLALSRGLVEAMGGSLLPRETAGGGLTMVVTLGATA